MKNYTKMYIKSINVDYQSLITLGEKEKKRTHVVCQPINLPVCNIRAYAIFQVTNAQR